MWFEHIDFETTRLRRYPTGALALERLTSIMIRGLVRFSHSWADRQTIAEQTTFQIATTPRHFSSTMMRYLENASMHEEQYLVCDH